MIRLLEQAQNTSQRAIAWVNKNGVPITLSQETSSYMQNALGEIRGNDYSNKHFYEIQCQLLDIASYLGEVIKDWRRDCNWAWHSYPNGKKVWMIVFSNNQYFDVLGAIVSCWVFTPEFPNRSVPMQIEFLRRRLSDT